jgi:hypothetical protein
VTQYRVGHDICKCGDYREDHENGSGACRICLGLNKKGLGQPPCRKFRFNAESRRC